MGFKPGADNLTDLDVDDGTLSVDETNNRVGIGTTSPGTQIQVESTAPYITLKNSTAENTAAGCESRIIFEDHGNNSLGLIEVSHVGTSDDEKGQMIFKTNNDTALQTALTISEAQLATFAGAVAATGFTVGTSVITDDSIVMTPSTDDTVTIAAATNGALAITTVDTNAAAANITITADGTFEAVGTTVTLDSGGAINLEPAAGSAILLDGTISVDAGVVTGATSVTVGTTVVTDDSIVMTPSTDDTVTIAAATNGALNITTVDNAAHGADLTLTVDGDTVMLAEGKPVARAVGTATSSTTNIANSFSFVRPVLKVTADTQLYAGDSGAMVIFNDAAATITLPDSGAAANLGVWFSFAVVNGDAGTKKIIVTDTSNERFAGLIKTMDTDSSFVLGLKSALLDAGGSAAANVSITFNGTTTGASGSGITLVATAADEWTIVDSQVLVTGDPSGVTPFGTS